MRNPNWTQRDDLKALALREAKVDAADIGQRLGRSADAVRRRLNWIKLSADERRAVNANRKDRQYRLAKAGCEQEVRA